MNGEGSAATVAIDYEKFRRSLKDLEVQYENYRNPPISRSPLDQEGIAESVIQRFETCYDCLWKMLKRYLIEVLGIPDPPNSPKPVFRLAHENHLFRAPVKQWRLYADRHNDTAHDYDCENRNDRAQVLHPRLGTMTPPTTTTAKRPRPASPSWPTSSTTPSASTRP